MASVKARIVEILVISSLRLVNRAFWGLGFGRQER